jgi:dipeptidyl-peptidase-4
MRRPMTNHSTGLFSGRAYPARLVALAVLPLLASCAAQDATAETAASAAAPLPPTTVVEAPEVPEPEPEAPRRKRLTLEQTAGRGERVDFRGNLERYRWAPDGKHLIRGKVWIDARTGTEVQREPPPDEKLPDEKPPKSDAPSPEPWRLYAAQGVKDEKRAKQIAGTRPQKGTNGGELRASRGELWFTRDGAARRLAKRGKVRIELPALSPDGERVAFVQGNDLGVIDTATGERRELTTDGSVDILNGKLDWVYQEEIYGRGRFKGFWWSPDSKHIAFLRLDESAVQSFTVVDHVERGHFRVKPEITNYPKAGDPNPTVKLGVASADGADRVRWIDLAKHADAEPLVVRVGWTPKGDRVLFMVQDRIQTWLELCAATPGGGQTQTLIRETSPSWVSRAAAPRWLEDGTFLWMSERTGHRHVYRYDASGEPMGAVTAGEWSVGRISAIDEEQRLLWFTASESGAVNTNTYRIGLDGSGFRRLTEGEGQHAVTWNADRSLFLLRTSHLGAPPYLRLCDADGRVLRELAVSEVPHWDEYLTSTWEHHHVAARDGFELDVALLRPVPSIRMPATRSGSRPTPARTRRPSATPGTRAPGISSSRRTGSS